ncbi:MAG: GNAT family N-acetyltransferase [Propionibacteriaceae bacterium]
MVDTLRLSDGVISLDPLRASDAEEHLRGEDEELQRWLSGGKSTIEGVRAYLGKVDRQWQARGPVFHFAVRVEPHLALAGTIDLQFDQPYARCHQVNLAYGIYPQWRRRGFATRAVNLSIQFLRDHTDAQEALIRTERANRASAMVAERAGFTAVPQLSDHQGMIHFERMV